MKISVPEPCHEDWNKMARQDKERFCNACSKAVIDFTDMSDRQLAEFFKRKKGPVCGRFHQDQLDRALVVPPKRIPWVKYFFQMLWPTFVLLFKSGAAKARVEERPKMAGVHAVSHAVAEGQAPLSSIQPAQEPAAIQAAEQKPLTSPSDTIPAPLIGDTVVTETSTPGAEFIMPNLMLDTVMIISASCSRSIVLGGASLYSAVRIESQPPVALPPAGTGSFKIFPNPARAGSLITVSCTEPENLPDQVQLFSSSGQLVSTLTQLASEEASVFNIHLPSSLAGGAYYLMLANSRTGQVVTEKILVL